MLLSLNYCRYFILPSTPNTTFSVMKYQYLLIYQIHNNMKNLNQYFYSNNINEESKNIVKEIINRKKRNFFIDGKRNFRNTLVHYQIDNINESLLDNNKIYGGLIEFYFNGKEYYEFHELLSNEIVRLSDLMIEWFYL